ncbi:MAG: aspartate dehydrogenase [Candidatus Omnitrophica bacterium]|nr:aspartate dehydrogenase [Candidatus Omnitrophota bacterium]MBU4472624.1 aspartate dehydrogenase [Candidatus Omnitrophota bacterium]MCG2706752.1 aspartate dehydrogenase [Candidatus Omnitrophota bacterium]
MNKLLNIGIVGCGAIGSSLAKAIMSDFAQQAELVSLYDSDIEKAYNLANKFSNRKLAALNLDELINKADLVIEATKADSAFDIAKKAISSSRDILIMSVGGLIQHYGELESLAREKKAGIYIPSGAVCGIDGLKAASFGKIKKVTLTTKKPPRAFAGSAFALKKKIRLDAIDKDTVLFEGNALSAIRLFSQNVNVAATLSIAGIGPERTIVRIIASPSAKRNTHEIEIESDAGRIFTKTENVIHPDNPKTSYLAVLSAIATLKQILEPVRIGT